MTRLSDVERRERAMPEVAVQRAVVDVAVALGWEWCHWRPAPRPNRRGGWAVPVMGTLGTGWPDLFLINAAKRRAIAIECKRELEHPTPAQERVGELLRDAGVAWMVIRPSDLRDPLEASNIVRILR